MSPSAADALPLDRAGAHGGAGTWTLAASAGSAGARRALEARATRDPSRDDARARRREEDARLAVAARGGDDEAFRSLVERYQNSVYWIANDVLLDADEARDVAQETFLRVHGALGAFDPTRDFAGWLYRIARNLAIDAFRRRRRRAVPVEDLRALPAPERAAADEDVRTRVHEVLAALPLEYRLALTLREVHGLAPREIAAITDCTYPTARWRLHRARALFRRLWEERFGPPAAEESPR